MSSKNKFQRQVEAIFKGFEVFLYVECPQGPSRERYPDLDHRPWIEFDLRDENPSHSKACCHVPLTALKKLAKLLGTEDVTVTGFDMSAKDDGTEYVGYVQAKGVKFKAKR